MHEVGYAFLCSLSDWIAQLVEKSGKDLKLERKYLDNVSFKTKNPFFFTLTLILLKIIFIFHIYI